MFGEVPQAVIELRVRYAETDQMGVVYHANYLVWCEVGRTELIRRYLGSYADLEKRGVMLAVADATIRFHSPARYDDLVRVTTSLATLRSRMVAFDYLVERVEEGGRTTRLATASTTLVALSPDNRPRTLPQDLTDALSGA